MVYEFYLTMKANAVELGNTWMQCLTLTIYNNMYCLSLIISAEEDCMYSGVHKVWLAIATSNFI